MHTYVESDHAQFAAMAEYQEKYGVKVKRWSDGPGGVREGLAGSAGRRIGQGSVVQEDRRPLSRLPQEVLGVGLVADDEAHLRRQVADRPARPSGRAGTSFNDDEPPQALPGRAAHAWAHGEPSA